LSIVSEIPKRVTPRKIDCFIERFISVTDRLPVSDFFRKWTAISTIAGALERRVWVDVGVGPLYPNCYIILVATAGIGKSVLSTFVREAWNEIPDFHVAPSNVTRAGLIDCLSEATCTFPFLNGNPPYSYNSLSVASSELGVWIPEWEPDFINHLTDLWDCGPYTERKRTGKIEHSIQKPSLNILGCTTPSWLHGTLPSIAWEQGFCSRTLFIFGNKRVIKSLGGPSTIRLDPLLIEDLRRIAQLRGPYRIEPDVLKVFNTWHELDGPPIPQHPKLISYRIRRTVHLLKLCMAVSASRRSDLVISLDEYQTALNLLLEAEAWMPQLFEAMPLGDELSKMHEVLHVLRQKYTNKREPIPERIVYYELMRRLPGHRVAAAHYGMVKLNMIKQLVEGYVPVDP
jgi:hypothetical protein